MTKDFDWLADFRRTLADTAIIYLPEFRELEEPTRERVLRYICERTYYYANSGARDRSYILRQVDEDVQEDWPQLDVAVLTQWAVRQVLNRIWSE